MTFFNNEHGVPEKLEKASDARLRHLAAILPAGLLEGAPDSLEPAVIALQAARAEHVESKLAEVQAGYRIHPTVPGFQAYTVKTVNGAEVFDEGLPGMAGMAEATTTDEAWTALVKGVRPYPAELFER